MPAKISEIYIQRIGDIDISKTFTVYANSDTYYALCPEYCKPFLPKNFLSNIQIMLRPKKYNEVLTGKNVSEVREKLTEALNYFYKNNFTEEKVIMVKFNYNSDKLEQRLGFNRYSYSGNNSPGLSLNYKIGYKVLAPGNTFYTGAPLRDQLDTKSWRDSEHSVKDYIIIPYTAERELFFKDAVNSLEKVIKQISDFLTSDKILTLIDKKTKFLS